MGEAKRRGGFEVTFRASADTGYVIAEAVGAAITAKDPMDALFVLSRLVASMPRRLRERVEAAAAEYQARYETELAEKLLADLPDPAKLQDAEARRRVAAERARREQLARTEGAVRALLSALGDVGGEAGFWFTLRQRREPGWREAGEVDESLLLP